MSQRVATGPPRQGDRPRRRWRDLAPPVLGATGVAVGALALHLRDPHVAGSWGVCPLALLTGGLDCPGCGALRAVHHLTDGDLAAAASSNLLLVLALPLVVLGWLLWLRRSRTGVPSSWPRHPLVLRVLVPATVLVVAGFAVLRNLPAGSWLHS